MAETPAVTNPAAKGLSTSEGKITLAAQIVGFLVATFGGLLTQYAQTHPSSALAGPSVMAMGMLLMVATQYGYVKGRAIVKSALLQGAIDWAAPEAEALVAKYLTRQLASAAVAVIPPPPPPAPSSVTVAAPYVPPTPQ